MKLESFPYIQAIQINDCYAIKDTHVQVFEEGEEYRHLILTGKNGSGKTTVLNEINTLIQSIRSYYPGEPEAFLDKENWFKDEQERVKIKFRNSIDTINNNNKNHVYSFFRASRILNVQNVKSPIKETEIIDNVLGNNLNVVTAYHPDNTLGINPPHSSRRFSTYFKHYLVNKKIEQAFEIIDKKQTHGQRIQDFFTNLETLFQNIFEDSGLKILFIKEDYEFKIIYSNGREVNFNQLSSGFSALLDIISELIVQVDLIRKSVNDYTYDPSGIVLIDEPENHAHLKMQEQVLPLLTTLFPRVQFIVATHSPAIIASIPNATVFDLSSKETFRDGLVGSSYSQLMIKLLGLNNQYSTLADQLLNKVNKLLLEKNREKAKTELQKILTENVELLSPSLYLEIESAIHLIQD